MSEFSGYCPSCGHKEDVSAHHPCEKCGAKMVITHMDGKSGAQIDKEEEG